MIAPDILGLTTGTAPKFAKSYSNLDKDIIEAFKKYCKEVMSGQFPDKGHSYHMKAGELEKLQELLKDTL
ncbi:MAG: 3-methyl-2-oxobutanoate hydroxymethyltransferase [Planctomycetota bacterium]